MTSRKFLVVTLHQLLEEDPELFHLAEMMIMGLFLGRKGKKTRSVSTILVVLDSKKVAGAILAASLPPKFSVYEVVSHKGESSR